MDWPGATLAPAVGASRPAQASGKRELTDIVELMFFAYRDFTGEADARLADRGLGRAHHRVIYFVSRHPGMSVTDLLGILKITKQSLARVLKTLIAEGYVTQQSGRSDKRQRRLFPTKQGTELADALTELQMARIEGALARVSEAERKSIRHFLLGMVSADEQNAVAALMAPNSNSDDCGETID